MIPEKGPIRYSGSGTIHFLCPVDLSKELPFWSRHFGPRVNQLVRKVLSFECLVYGMDNLLIAMEPVNADRSIVPILKLLEKFLRPSCSYERPKDYSPLFFGNRDRLEVRLRHFQTPA